MFAYIRKDDNKELSTVLSPDYIDDIMMNIKRLESNSCNEMNNFLSPYVDETHLNQRTDSSNSSQHNPYCNEDAIFSDPSRLHHSHSSLPDYIEERSSHCTDEKKSQNNSLSSSYSSFTSPQCHAEIPDRLSISKKVYTSSLPELTPLVSNPLFAKDCELPQYDTTNSIQVVTSSCSNLNDNQKQLNGCTKESASSELNILNSDARLNTSSVEFLNHSRYYESSSNSNKQIDSNTTMYNSTCDSHSVAVTESTSGHDIQTSSSGYYELPADKNNFKHFVSSANSSKSSLSELEFNNDDQFCDTSTVATSTNTDKCSGSNVDSGYSYTATSFNENIA